MHNLRTLVAGLTPTITSTLAVCSSSRSRTELLTSLTSLHTSLGQVFDRAKSLRREATQTRRSTSVLCNTVEGLINGLEQDDLPLKELRSISATIRPKFKLLQDTAEQELGTYVVEPVQDKPVKLVVARGAEWQQNLAKQWNAIAETAPAKASQHVNLRRLMDQDVQDAATAQYIARLKQEHGKLPAHVEHGFGLARLSVIPLFSNPVIVTSDLLTRCAIPHNSIGGYPVLENQFILMVERAMVDKVKVPKRQLDREGISREVKTSLSDQQIAARNRPLVALAEHALETINQSTEKCALVTEKFVANPKNPDILCFWIMQERKLSAFQRLTHEKTHVTKWSLAFNPEED